jgi:hypothetical protein
MFEICALTKDCPFMPDCERAPDMAAGRVELPIRPIGRR